MIHVILVDFCRREGHEGSKGNTILVIARGNNDKGQRGINGECIAADSDVAN